MPACAHASARDTRVFRRHRGQAKEIAQLREDLLTREAITAQDPLRFQQNYSWHKDGIAIDEISGPLCLREIVRRQIANDDISIDREHAAV
jgi:hypothetical protein